MSESRDLVFDPYDYATQDDPYPVYARLRDEEPLHHNADHDFWVLSRHADVAVALRDDTTYSSAMGVTLDASAWSPDAHRVMSFLALDGLEQTRIRSLVSRAFTPRRVRELVPRLQQLTDRYLDRALADGDELDWIADLSGLLPMDVISEMMGVPEADRDEVRRLSDLLVHRESGVRDVPPAGIEAAGALFSYYTDLIARRRRRPADDLTSALLQAEVDGDRLSDVEVMAFLFLMVVAGNETTTKLLGNAVHHLAAHPAQLEQVLADPDELLAPWIEETLRHDTSTQALARHLRADVTLHGRTAPAGSKLLVLLGSANRDERVFSEPSAYDVRRPKDELGRTLSFGTGRHYCLGANLARIEARVVLAELVRRVDWIEVDTLRAQRVHSTNVRGFARLPIAVRRRR